MDPAPSVSRAELLGRLDDAAVAALTAGPVDSLPAVPVRRKPLTFLNPSESLVGGGRPWAD